MTYLLALNDGAAGATLASSVYHEGPVAWQAACLRLTFGGAS